MDDIRNVLKTIDNHLENKDEHALIPFADYLKMVRDQPTQAIRSIFQVFHDMIKTFVGPGFQEYPNDPESINFLLYNFHELLVEGVDNPFFADRLFANRLINNIEAMRHGAQQNKIYIFEGPPGCGKSTFLNNLLLKFEEYANTEEGSRYEIVWKLDRRELGGMSDSAPLIENFFKYLEKNNKQRLGDDLIDPNKPKTYLPSIPQEDFLEIPCPSHDSPLLLVPKHLRREFFDDLLKNDEFKYKLSSEKEYEWVFKQNPCTICTSLAQAVLKKVGTTEDLFNMVFARKYHFNRRLGEGISVFNPGDKHSRDFVLTNTMLQERLNNLLKDSNQVHYIFSRYAKTNNGIYALMDIKLHNVERINALHNIISEGVHKLEDIEENVNSLFFALMNPEDKSNIEGTQSFSDRIEYIKINYVLDINTEADIYRSIFGKHIEKNFLPHVLKNFARVIISTRLNQTSAVMVNWIETPDDYSQYCDENLMLLKMEIYRGKIPTWLSEEHQNEFNADKRRKIIAESEKEGTKGFSGRDSIKIFNDFFSAYSKEGKHITMANLNTFFEKLQQKQSQKIPEGFLDSLLRMYNYHVLQDIKESLYYYNEEQISRDIQNYVFALNFETGTTVSCVYTGERITISEDFLISIENRLLGVQVSDARRQQFRKETQREYTSKTLTQEIMIEKKPVTETGLYLELRERYVYNLKEKVLEPFLDNENFRRAIKDYGTDDFRTYDKRIREDVTFLLKNLTKKYGCEADPNIAREVCMYVIDNDLARNE